MTNFTKKNLNTNPLTDTVFAVARLAKEEIKKLGSDHVINATVGSLIDDEGELVAFKSVFEHYNSLPSQTKARYAAHYSGNANYRYQVFDWVFQNEKIALPHTVIATPGGSGALSLSFSSFLDEGDSILLPNIAWESYEVMAEQYNIHPEFYQLFNASGLFNLQSFKTSCLHIIQKQKKLMVVINDPCHNPTGYSMTLDEWSCVLNFLNECACDVPVILLQDLAYIDYSYNLKQSRKHFPLLNTIHKNLLVALTFSCSKTCTSYGLRCGALILIAQQNQVISQLEQIFEKGARAIWSNIPNAAMDNFAWVTSNNYFNFISEKQIYIDLLKERSTLFLKEAKDCQLPLYPYKEGFFITIACKDNQQRDKLHTALINHHIFTVKVNLGIRIAICSCPTSKLKGLALTIRCIIDKVEF